MTFNTEFAKKLISVYGPPGDEGQVAEILMAELKDYADDMHIDKLGNLLVHKKGKEGGKKIQFSAHMDHLGMIVTFIDEKGLLYFGSNGGIRPANILDARVEFKNGVQGVVCTSNPKDTSKLAFDNLFIDLGTLSKEETLKLVQVGDVAVFKGDYYETKQCVMSRSMDDRIACYILAETLKQLGDTENDLHFTFSVQEEVGLRGARVASYNVNPDYFFALDITGSGDFPGAPKMALKLGDGAAIKLRDGSLLTPKHMSDLLIGLCEKNEIKYQREVLLFGGTDAGAAQTMRGGIDTGAISIPTRHIHGSSEICSKFDINECIRLTKAVCEHKFA